MKSDFNLSSGQTRRQLRNHTLIAPINWHQERRFKDLTVDASGHGDLLAAVQRFRGKAYLEDGALHPSQLTADGRFCQAADYHSWHLVVQNDQGEVISCARYYPIPDAQFESTSASKSALAKSPEWRAQVKRAVEASIRQAAERGASFSELGGWCIANEARNTSHALRSVLLMFALGEILGGTVGLSTATKRHSSSSILQRLGAQNAGVNGETLPSYYEPMFDCEMELLQFDSLRPAARYAPRVAEYAALMKSEIRVLCREAVSSYRNASLSLVSKAPAPAAHSETRVFAQAA